MEERSHQVAYQLRGLVSQTCRTSASKRSSCNKLGTELDNVLAVYYTTACMLSTDVFHFLFFLMQIFLLIEIFWPVVLYVIMAILRLQFPPVQIPDCMLHVPVPDCMLHVPVPDCTLHVSLLTLAAPSHPLLCLSPHTQHSTSLSPCRLLAPSPSCSPFCVTWTGGL